MSSSARDPETRRLQEAIEATRLGFGLTATAIATFAANAMALGVRGICVPRQFLPDALGAVREMDRTIDLVTVVNFPFGDQSREIVLAEVSEAVRLGAEHLDVVLPGALIAERRWGDVGRFLGEVRDHATAVAPRPVLLKAILETAAFDEDRIRGAALAAIEAGARWLKTSTGFHPSGGATEAAVALLRSLAPPSVGVKASGGIRTRNAAIALLDAGADRIGTSAEAAILTPVG